MLNIPILLAYLKSNKKGVEFTMSMLVIIIIAIIGLVLFVLFITGKWASLTSSLGGVEESAMEGVPK